MKFNEFDKIRKKAIEINGLNESAKLSDYKDSLNEAIDAINETGEEGVGSEDIGDFFFGHLKAMKSLAILSARYPMIAKKKNKIELKAYEKSKAIEAKGKEVKEQTRENLRANWKAKLDKLPVEKREAGREAAKQAIDKKIDFIDQKVKAEIQKINSKGRADVSQVSDKWSRIEGRNSLPREVWSHRWSASKARTDGNAEVDLIEMKIAVDEKYSNKEGGSMDQQIEKLHKKAQQEKADSEEKAKEAEELAKKEENAQFDKLDDATKEAMQELQPILNDFIKFTSEYESTGEEIITTYSELENEEDDYEKMDDEEKKANADEHKESINKLKEEIKKSKAELDESKKSANKAKEELKNKKEVAKKGGLWETINKQIQTFVDAQEQYKRDLGYNDEEDKPQTTGEEEEELSPSAKKLKDEIDDLKDALSDLQNNPKKNGDKIGILKISIENKQKQLDKMTGKKTDNKPSKTEPEEKPEDPKKEELITKAKSEVDKHQKDVLDKYKDDLDKETSADEPDKDKIANLETEVAKAEIQKAKLQRVVVKLEDKEDADKKLKELEDKINDLTDEVQAKKPKEEKKDENSNESVIIPKYIKFSEFLNQKNDI